MPPGSTATAAGTVFWWRFLVLRQAQDLTHAEAKDRELVERPDARDLPSLRGKTSSQVCRMSPVARLNAVQLQAAGGRRGKHLYDEVLEDVEHRHIVATIPIRLRCFFRYDRKHLDILFGALWAAVLEVLVPSGARPGLVDTVQTFAENLHFNPHLHGILTNGAWLRDGSFVPFATPTPEVLDKLTRRFAERVLAALEARGLITAEVTAQILSQEHILLRPPTRCYGGQAGLLGVAGRALQR